jgi:hypothetical protein
MEYLPGLIIAVLFAWITYGMAQKRGRNEVLWGILGFLFTFIPAIILLIIGTSKDSPSA